MAGISQLNGLLSDMNIIHNTFAARLGGSYTRVVQPPSSGNITLVMLDNLFAASSQGVKADGKTEGRASIEGAGLNVDWRGNLIVGRDSSLYGTYAATNQFPETDAALAYTDQDAGDYSLSGASPYKGDATDATDPGADWAALLAATAGVQR